MVCPVTYLDISLAKNNAVSATSSGVPPLLNGIVFNHSSLASSGIWFVMSVMMKPGAIQLALMLRDPISLAIDLARPIIPAFDAE